MFDVADVFDGLYQSLRSRGGFVPMIMPAPMMGFHAVIPFSGQQSIGGESSGCSCGGTCGSDRQETKAAEVDDEMQKRRELNTIREQMRLAAENEDFEKAAQLRDKLKELEG